ncbi:hypothetical protein GCM10023335_56440 [Streptomyces siamensis]|uniref:Uncharacterized protein n=1 Tax=Streptomyces siamensis TaxID=1274986 RepID=A0ABP9J9V7_9ACTN
MANFRTLAELAARHEQQTDPLARPQRRVAALVEHQRSADFIRHMIGNRAVADLNRLTLGGALHADGPRRWCERHGYRCISSWGDVGVIAQRGTELPVAASLGDSLVWGGERITLENPAQPA